MPEPDRITRSLCVQSDPAVAAQMASPELQDDTLGFGPFVMTPGTAYTGPTASMTNGASAAVGKELTQVGNRVLLVESLPYASLMDQFLALPDCSPSSGQARLDPSGALGDSYASIPRPPEPAAVAAAGIDGLMPGAISGAGGGERLASLAQPGVCIDYVANIGGTITTPVTLQSFTNYLITGTLYLNGPAQIEGRTVLKFIRNASIQLNNTLTCAHSGSYSPIVATAVDDDSIGDSMKNVSGSGYTGVINTNGYANPVLSMNGITSLSLTNFRFCYAVNGIYYDSASAVPPTITLSHCQMLDCYQPFNLYIGPCGGEGGSGSCTTPTVVNLNNTLVSRVRWVVDLDSESNPVDVTLINCTVDNTGPVVWGYGDTTVALYSTNCIYANMSNSGNIVTAYHANNNGFYNTTPFGSSTYVASASPFQSVGAGNYYLASGSAFHGAATNSGVPPSLAADLAQRTTYPPEVTVNAWLTNSTSLSPQALRDTGPLDIGYHYDPIDYAFGWVVATNTILTIGPGTAVATFGTNGSAYGLSQTNGGAFGLALGQGATFECAGVATNPVWLAQYNTVQEQPTNGWFRPAFGNVVSEFQGLSPGAAIECSFTDWATPSLDAPAFYAPTNIGPFNFQDCEFHGGQVLLYGPAATLTNCLLERVFLSLEPADTNVSGIRNCEVYGGSFNVLLTNASTCLADNLFDQAAVTNGNRAYTGFNAYVTNGTSAANARLQPTNASDRVLSAPFAYETGPLGNYYQATNSPLLLADNTTTASAVGLSAFTVTTNLSGGYEIPETNGPVSLGYHYMAMGTNGQPVEAVPGFPNYANWETDGTSIPAWWQIQYFGTNGVNPYALCPSGDGWTLLQAYQNGWSPWQSYTPPPPQNVVATLDSDGTDVTITWSSGGGQVSGYTVESFYPFGEAGAYWVTNTEAGSSTFRFTDPGCFSSPPWNIQVHSYAVTAYFSNGSNAPSPLVPVNGLAPAPNATVARGPSGNPYLVLGSVPAGLSQVLLTWSWLSNGQYIANQSMALSATTFQGGIALLPLSQMPGYAPDYSPAVQFIMSNGIPSVQSSATVFPPYDPNWRPWDWGAEKDALAASTYSAVDARVHMRENLKFLLRSATIDYPFSYDSTLSTADGTGSPLTYAGDLSSPESTYARPQSPLSYEYYGFRVFGPDIGYAIMQELRPVQENYIWRNLAYSATNLVSDIYGMSDLLGYGAEFPPARLLEPPLGCEFSGPVSSQVPAAMNSTNSTYLFGAQLNNYVEGDAGEFGMSLATNGTQVNATLPAGIRNCYGLQFESLFLIDGLSGNPVGTVSPSSSPPVGQLWDGVAVAQWPDFADVFADCDVPALANVGYYFVSQTPYLSQYWSWAAIDNGLPGYQGPPPPIPGSPSFSPTNTSPLLLTSVGQPISVSGWAQMAISNGYAGKYAYLEQFFTNALTIDVNGNVTTNSAGVLSPYGEFFPTVAGPAALVTMPDIDTGQQGTGIVNVLKLQLDVNHDGIMDLSWAGPDNTSQTSPYQFWINNDFDRVHWLNGKWAEDDLDSDDPAAASPYTGAPAPDCEYRNSLNERVIPCERDLEDFARLWICGVTPNLLAALPPGTSGVLSWGDVGNPNTNNPTIDLFGAADASGGIGYLTNLLTAMNQTNPSLNTWVGTLGPGGSIVVLSNGWVWQNFIWCGVNSGSGTLTLTITQGGTNTLGKTSASIQLQDIKQMYERYTVGDSPSGAPAAFPTLAGEGVPAPFKYGPPGNTNTPYILLVHDWDLPLWKKDRFAETAFKRLYWQGYQGRFGLFRWPGVYNGILWPLDDSEFNAWNSAAGLLNLLTNLNTTYPGRVYLAAHGYGAIVAGEALRLAGTNQVVNTYVAMQGAVPSGSYDPAAPLRPAPPGVAYSTPDRYGFYYTNGAPPYFWGAGGAANYFNYFNTDDYALTNSWCSTENTKPDWGYHWNGTSFSKGWFPPYSPLLFPGNTYQIFSYCDQAPYYAIGAQSNVAGPFWNSFKLTYTQLNLGSSPVSFGHQQNDHSAQFLYDCYIDWDFWTALLGTFGL